MSAAFYCVADERYFLGAVGLVNSLRLVGHSEPIHLLDCGLADEQRELIAGEVEVHAAPSDTPPWLLKAILPRRIADGVRILIDTDMIVTRRLDDLIDRAQSGRVVAFRDRQQRFFAAWGPLTGLGEARPRPYVSSGFVALAGTLGDDLLGRLDELRDVVDFDRTFWRRNERDYPFLYADQDLLNAILATWPDPDAVAALDESLAATPPYRGLSCMDTPALRCAYRDGTEPYVLHQYVRKPWLEPTFDGLYPRLLRRLLTAGDVAVKVPPGRLPPWLRAGSAGRAARVRANARDYLRWHLGDRLPAPIATRLEDRRHRREGRR